MTLNLEKSYFRQTEANFLGYQITSEGVLPANRKVEAILEFKTPSNIIKELRSFMGMAQQLSRFSPLLAEAAEPLRGLLSSTNEWVWTGNYDLAFNKVKQVLSNPPVLALYDVNKPTRLRTDGSKLNGISVVVHQKHENEWRPVDCASRFSSSAEKNYCPVDTEMLAVTWMSVYVHGLPELKSVQVISH